MKKFVSFCLSVLLITLNSSVYAELHGRLPATPNGIDYQAYYDDILDITWLQDTNIAATLLTDTWITDKLIGLTFADGAVFRLTSIDFQKDVQGNYTGLMSWPGAKAWAYDFEFFDKANGFTFRDWRLPNTHFPDTGCSVQDWPLYYGGFGCNKSELAHLRNVYGTPFPVIEPFSNVQDVNYFYRRNSGNDETWAFNFVSDLQDLVPMMDYAAAWLVHDGDIEKIINDNIGNTGFVNIGDLYAVNDSSNTINRYSSDGQYIESINLPDYFGFEIRGIAPGPGNLLYIAVVTDFGFRIVTLDQQGNLNTIGDGTDYLKGSGFSGNIAVSDAGHVYLAVQDNLVLFRPGSSTGEVIYTENGVYDVEILPSGNLLVVSTYELREISPIGTIVKEIKTSINLVSANGVEYDPNSNIIYITMGGFSGQFHRLMKIDPATGNVIKNGRYIYGADMFFTAENTLIVGSSVQAPGIFSTDLNRLGVLGVRNQIFVTQMKSFDTDNQDKSICDIPPVSVRGNCAGTYRAYTAEDIERFTNSDFGKSLDELGRVTYNNLLIAGNIGEPDTALEIHTPCRVTVDKDSTLVGSDINLHSRMGIVTKWLATIEAKNQACLISDERGVFIKGGNTISANALAVKAKTSAIIGRRSHVNVLGPIELLSTGSGQTSKAKVGIGTKINSDSFTASADAKTVLSYQASVSTTDKLSIKSHNVDGETILNAESHLLSEGNIEIGSAGVTNIRANSVLTTSQNIDISAQTGVHCSLAGTVSIASNSIAGNCIAPLP